MGLSAGFLDKALQGRLSCENLALIVTKCANLLDKDLLQAVFRVASSSGYHGDEIKQVTQIIREVGLIARRKEITLEVKDCLGKSFTNHEEFTDSRAAIISSVLHGLAPEHGTEFIKGILSHVAAMDRPKSDLYSDEWRDRVWRYTGEVFNGSTLLLEVLPALSAAGVKGVIDFALAVKLSVADAGRGKILGLHQSLIEGDSAWEFVGAAQSKFLRAESQKKPSREPPHPLARSLWNLWNGRVSG
jgi:hypothetical protein